MSTLDPRDEHVDTWLRTVRASLLDGLDEVLDVQAGLRDALLPARRRALLESLDDVVDTHAGLAAIVPPKGPSVSDTPAMDMSSPEGRTDSLGDFVILFERCSPHDRISARIWLPEGSLVAAQGITELLCSLQDVYRVYQAIHSSIESSELTARKEAMKYTQSFVRVLSEYRSASRPRHDPDLNQALNIAQAHFDFDTVAQISVGDGRNALKDIDFNLRRALKASIDFRHAGSAIRFASTRLSSAQQYLGHQFTKALYGEFVAFPSERALENEEYDYRLIDIIDRLREASTNAVDADCSALDLDRIPLDGLRWSPGTRWPEGWKDRIRDKSVLIAPGLFRIDPGHGGKDRTMNTAR